MNDLTHDCIVIGAGSAGCALTRRLLDATERTPTAALVPLMYTTSNPLILWN